MKIFKRLRISIRSKLMLIISGTVLTSLILLTIISLGIFEEDMKNMVTLVTSKTTKLLTEKVQTEMSKQMNLIKMVDSLLLNNDKSEKNIEFIKTNFLNRKSDLLYLQSIKIKKDNEIIQNYNLINNSALKKHGIKKKKILEYKKKLKSEIIKASKGAIIIKNISHVFQKPITLLLFSNRSKKKNKNVLLAILNASSMLTIFYSKKGQKSIYQSFLVDANGNPILHPDEKIMFKKTNLSKHPAVYKMFSSLTRSGIIHFQKNNKEYIGSYRKSKTGSWGTITYILQSTALEGVQVVKIRSIIISFLIISIAILFIYYFSNTISKPIRKLAKGAIDIKKGNYNIIEISKSKDEIADLGLAFNDMVEGLKEKEKLKSAFGKFVNEEIAKMILSGSLELGGELKEATIFFSDIRAFTAISEKLSPQEVVEFLNEYMTLMVDIIHDKKGIVDKFIGDAIMAIWGAPISYKNDVENCIDSAIAMRKALVKFNKNRGSKTKPIIKIGCGINTGPVLAGQIGSNDRLEYTVIGDAVNLASRVETLCKPFAVDVLISENTYILVKDKYKCIAMQKIRVKGKSKPQQIYAVLGRREDNDSPKSLVALRKMIQMTLPKGTLNTSEEKKYEII